MFLHHLTSYAKCVMWDNDFCSVVHSLHLELAMDIFIMLKNKILIFISQVNKQNIEKWFYKTQYIQLKEEPFHHQGIICF